MKKFLIISWAFFILGVAFKLFHIQFSNWSMLLGCLLMLIHSIIFLIKNAKTDLPQSFLYLTATFWTIYLFFRIVFLSGIFYIFGFPIIFIIPLFFSIICFILHVIKQIPFKLPQILVSIYLIFSIMLSYTHSNKIYYFIRLNTVLNNESRNTDFSAWDKYSWYLNLSHKTDEAINANENAKKAAEESLKQNNSEETFEYLDVIKKHKQQIAQGTWNYYDF
jgi:hypothetical protein